MKRLSLLWTLHRQAFRRFEQAERSAARRADRVLARYRLRDIIRVRVRKIERAIARAIERERRAQRRAELGLPATVFRPRALPGALPARKRVAALAVAALLRPKRPVRVY